MLLHFEAIDWESHIYLNNELLDIHQGGYDAFYFDITDRVKDAPSSTYELLVGVWDPTGANNSPKGKQAEGEVSHAGGLSYTSTSGIWGECLAMIIVAFECLLALVTCWELGFSSCAVLPNVESHLVGGVGL